MLPSWILVLLLLPGWLLPSGLRVPLCGCLFAPAERSCCAPVEPAHGCCAADAEDSAPADDAPSVEREPACACSVAVPDLDGSATTPATLPAFAIPPPALPRVEVATIARSNAVTRAGRDRPRGPSPGGSNPLPLRL
jgi:hypothetical protein